ncbi:hypothetical protein Zmor_015132 [Zophobas morio]|uniref:Peptidase S1 domain-containing protein n=1 Tax=Zophobas morio TaxID=2755281 RepID=A0AA38IG54_9CUCU|nr:hypothetical protein Zmor_015132 [Zophobas morio]
MNSTSNVLLLLLHFLSVLTIKFFCGGTLYNQEWVLTSGHCVYNAILFTIQLGSAKLEGEDPSRETVATSEYIIHPDFNPNTITNDIGLIKFRMPIQYTDYIRPINLPIRATQESELVISTGWGQTSDTDAQLSNVLQNVVLTSLSNEECRTVYGNQITETMICAAGNYNEGICIGDTGSPLIDHQTLWGTPTIVGISSFMSANGCENTDPSGYTRTYYYIDWIKNVTAS